MRNLLFLILAAVMLQFGASAQSQNRQKSLEKLQLTKLPNAKVLGTDSNKNVIDNTSEILNLINQHSGSGSETDPVFSSWDKDYADLINTPIIPDVSGKLDKGVYNGTAADLNSRIDSIIANPSGVGNGIYGGSGTVPKGTRIKFAGTNNLWNNSQVTYDSCVDLKSDVNSGLIFGLQKRYHSKEFLQSGILKPYDIQNGGVSNEYRNRSVGVRAIVHNKSFVEALVCVPRFSSDQPNFVVQAKGYNKNNYKPIRSMFFIEPEGLKHDITYPYYGYESNMKIRYDKAGFSFKNNKNPNYNAYGQCDTKYEFKIGGINVHMKKQGEDIFFLRNSFGKFYLKFKNEEAPNYEQSQSVALDTITGRVFYDKRPVIRTFEGVSPDASGNIELVLTSPDGIVKKRLGIDNDGNLTLTDVE